MPHVHLVIRGRVQGVGFRYFVAREAQRLRLSGTVSNRRDASVEVEAEGDRDALTLLVAAVWRGPSAAHVTGVAESWSEGPPRHVGFHIATERP
jgi:acylphosphatase